MIWTHSFSRTIISRTRDLKKKVIRTSNTGLDDLGHQSDMTKVSFAVISWIGNLVSEKPRIVYSALRSHYAQDLYCHVIAPGDVAIIIDRISNHFGSNSPV